MVRTGAAAAAVLAADAAGECGSRHPSLPTIATLATRLLSCAAHGTGGSAAGTSRGVSAAAAVAGLPCPRHSLAPRGPAADTRSRTPARRSPRRKAGRRHQLRLVPTQRRLPLLAVMAPHQKALPRPRPPGASDWSSSRAAFRSLGPRPTAAEAAAAALVVCLLLLEQQVRPRLPSLAAAVRRTSGRSRSAGRRRQRRPRRHLSRPPQRQRLLRPLLLQPAPLPLRLLGASVAAAAAAVAYPAAALAAARRGGAHPLLRLLPLPQALPREGEEWGHLLSLPQPSSSPTSQSSPRTTMASRRSIWATTTTTSRACSGSAARDRYLRMAEAGLAAVNLLRAAALCSAASSAGVLPDRAARHAPRADSCLCMSSESCGFAHAVIKSSCSRGRVASSISRASGRRRQLSDPA